MNGGRRTTECAGKDHRSELWKVYRVDLESIPIDQTIESIKGGFHINRSQFFALYTDLSNYPVPVQLRHNRDRGEHESSSMPVVRQCSIIV